LNRSAAQAVFRGFMLEFARDPMRLAAPIAVPHSAPSGSRPRDNELDLYGLTHPGRVRDENQDHFLLGTVHPQVVVHGTSLPSTDGLELRGQRLATIMLVADGVGGSVGGSDASRITTEAVTRYFSSTLRCYHTVGSVSESDFTSALRAAAHEAHSSVRAEAQSRGESRDMATTLSLAIFVWPWLYVLQVGDSRCYFYEDGALRQVTRDQTLAQDMIDRGVLSPEKAHASPLNHVLSSAIGATESLPEITRVDIRQRGCVTLVCSDGLTKHVSDQEIGEHLGSMTSSEQVCKSLLQLALDRGGSDNITLVVGRALQQEGTR
ncbi:MAG: protein phosphatase 2C domain-containing protein, partial [Gemmatimonas sp.]